MLNFPTADIISDSISADIDGNFFIARISEVFLYRCIGTAAITY